MIILLIAIYDIGSGSETAYVIKSGCVILESFYQIQNAIKIPIDKH